MIILAFISLGFLIGNLVGLTSESVVMGIIPLLFTFAGGSAIAFFRKIPKEDQKKSAQALFAISFSCLIGIYFGIFISEYQLISKKNEGENRFTIEQKKYLRTEIIKSVNAIDMRYRLSGSEGRNEKEFYKELNSVADALIKEVAAINNQYKKNEIDSKRAYELLIELLRGKE
jgi:hypothetical protein